MHAGMEYSSHGTKLFPSHLHPSPHQSNGTKWVANIFHPQNKQICPAQGTGSLPQTSPSSPQ